VQFVRGDFERYRNVVDSVHNPLLPLSQAEKAMLTRFRRAGKGENAPRARKPAAQAAELDGKLDRRRDGEVAREEGAEVKRLRR
jgi:hypothetical protein